MDHTKVFGIGFHKTGTFSLFHAFRRVGLPAVHYLSWYREGLAQVRSRAEVLEVSWRNR